MSHYDRNKVYGPKSETWMTEFKADHNKESKKPQDEMLIVIYEGLYDKNYFKDGVILTPKYTILGTYKQCLEAFPAGFPPNTYAVSNLGVSNVDAFQKVCKSALEQEKRIGSEIVFGSVDETPNCFAIYAYDHYNIRKWLSKTRFARPYRM
jgi:hypothetical protein